MWTYLGPAFLCLLIIATAAFFDLHAKMVFLTCGYSRVHHHGKSWKRATAHYRENWSIWKRLFWVPVFAEAYTAKIRALAILSYLHDALAVIFLSLYAAADLAGAIPDLVWILFLAVIFLPYTLGKFIYTNALARGKI